MSGLLWILFLTCLPLFGNLLGTFLGETLSISKKMLSIALHGTAGVILAVIGLGLFPRILLAHPHWLAILSFLGGGGFFILMDRSLDLVRSRFGIARGRKDSWIIYFGVSVDLFTDGLLLGAGAAFSVGLGAFLASALVLADVPFGFATTAALKRRGVPRRRRLWLSSCFALPLLMGG